MYGKPAEVSPTVQILIRLLQFFSLVLLIANACTFIKNVIDWDNPQNQTLDLNALSMKFVDPDEENVLENLR